MKILLLISTTFLASNLIFAHGIWEPSQASHIGIGEIHTIYSDVLGEERAYWVSLPRTYNDKKVSPKKYPVLYIIDGEWYFHSTVGVVAHINSMVNQQAPEMIVVGIPNTSDRIRNLSPTPSQTDWRGEKTDKFATGGGADTFLRFITKELIPVIDDEYRTRDFRLIAGVSFGGLFALNTLLSQPELFQCYIGVEPALWWHDGLLNKKLVSLRPKMTDVHARVFISIANYNTTGRLDGSNLIIENMRFAEQLQNGELLGIATSLRRFPREDHNSVTLLGIYYGILHCFEGYRPPVNTVLAGATAIEEHFHNFSKKMDAKFLPPEDYIDLWATSLEGFYDEPRKALDLLILNVKNFPASFYAHSRLAEFYLKFKNYRLARKHYKKVISLDPENREAKLALEMLEL